MSGLTKRQVAVLGIIRAYMIAWECSPTLAEVGKFLGIKKGAVWHHVDALIRKRRLYRDGAGSRNLRLTTCCPLCGARPDDGAAPVTQGVAP